MFRASVTLVSWLALSFAAFASQAEDEIPLEYFAMREVVGDAALSPDGKYLAVMKIPTKDGNPIVEVYEAADLSKKPFGLNADPMEIVSIGWITDTNLVFQARQMVRDQIEGFNQGVYESRVVSFDMRKKKLDSFDETALQFERALPGKPNKLIVSYFDSVSAGEAGKLSEGFRPRAYYELDVKKGTKKLLIRGKVALGNIDFDAEGNPLFARGANLRSEEATWYHRPGGRKDWNEIYRSSFDNFEDFELMALDYPRKDYALVLAQRGHDKRGLWTFNLKTGKLDELLYRRGDVDILGVRFHSNPWTHPDQVVGVVYAKGKLRTEFFDEVEGATYAQLERLIPEAYDVEIIDRSRDGNSMIISNSGPRDPGTFYLLKNGRLDVIGSKQPLIKSEQLADVRYITYKARDGRTIPAHITVPNGKEPFPLVVMPHGGPFVEEWIRYDEWAQLLASRGYLVLQPQYRGSKGYGMEFYKISFDPKGQGGYKMQDDKDDGALYLVEEGLADPDRIAMFGWSYGGYAALVAASRKPQIHQCVIAGAAVADTNMQVNYYRYEARGAQALEQLNMWDDSISPINEVAKVNVPMLVIHGDVDQRVPVDHARKYRKLLEEHNKPHKYIELKGADHFSNTLFYNHQKTLYTAMLDFLENDCGPGGL